LVRNQAVSDCDVLGLCECDDCEIKIKTQGSITAWDAQIAAAKDAKSFFNNAYFNERLADELSGKVGDRKSCKIVP
jgi:hypothetical protein